MSLIFHNFSRFQKHCDKRAWSVKATNRANVTSRTKPAIGDGDASYRGRQNARHPEAWWLDIHELGCRVRTWKSSVLPFAFLNVLNTRGCELVLISTAIQRCNRRFLSVTNIATIQAYLHAKPLYQLSNVCKLWSLITYQSALLIDY